MCSEVGEGHQGGEELQSSACSGLGSARMGDLLEIGELVWRRTPELSLLKLGQCRDG